jgi:hypothetical protein
MFRVDGRLEISRLKADFFDASVIARLLQRAEVK